MPRGSIFVSTSEFPFGLTRTQFRHLRRDEKLKAMVEWFEQNFEDPANSLPYVSREGGYQWVEGGPHDAREELSEKFEIVAGSKLVDEAVELLEADGLFDWAAKPRHDDAPEDKIRDDDQPVGLDDIPSIYGPAYGSKEDIDKRQSVVEALGALFTKLENKEPGIGHNNPPDDFGDDDLVPSLKNAVIDLQVEFKKISPAIQVIKASAAVLQNAIVASAKWLGKKADNLIDAGVATFGAGVATIALAELNPTLKSTFHLILDWLQTVTSPF